MKKFILRIIVFSIPFLIVSRRQLDAREVEADDDAGGANGDRRPPHRGFFSDDEQRAQRNADEPRDRMAVHAALHEAEREKPHGQRQNQRQTTGAEVSR